MAAMSLMMNSLVAASQDESAWRQAAADWHRGLVTFIETAVPELIRTVILATIAITIVSFFVRRLRRRADHTVANAHRAAQLRTVASIVRASSYGLIGIYVAIQILAAINVRMGPFIASAGVIGLGISFGAQSIFKDVLNGIFVLVEDQYSVGDVVKLTGLTGTVEDLTLRITKLRDGDGTLYIIPNSQVTTVSNLSRDFSVATLQVSVDAHENPDHVVDVLKHLAASVRADSNFADIILADPDILGVDKITGHEVIYPINLRVRANQRDGVLRELRRRILIEFQKEHINFGAASSTVLIQGNEAASSAATH